MIWSYQNAQVKPNIKQLQLLLLNNIQILCSR